MAAVAESWTPAWQAAPPPAIQIRGVEGRFRQKLNGSYQLTPHNGPKPALTYVNPTNNSCVVYGHHDKAGKVDFTGWVAGICFKFKFVLLMTSNKIVLKSIYNSCDQSTIWTAFISIQKNENQFHRDNSLISIQKIEN